jgi:hypothetical protein
VSSSLASSLFGLRHVCTAAVCRPQPYPLSASPPLLNDIRLTRPLACADPPLAALDPAWLWVPSGQVVTGTNDRHAVMSRAAAGTYFRRWELVMGAELLAKFGVYALQRMGPEDFLRTVLDKAAIPWGEFPNTAFLACCGGRSEGACFATGCWAIPSLPKCGEGAYAEDELHAPTVGSAGAVQKARGVRCCQQSPGCRMLRGKYPDEVAQATQHWRFLHCGGPKCAPPCPMEPTIAIRAWRRPLSPGPSVRCGATPFCDIR